jgi:hypothetical protein
VTPQAAPRTSALEPREATAAPGATRRPHAKRAPSPVFEARGAPKIPRPDLGPAPPFPLGPRLDPLRRDPPASVVGLSPLVADLRADTSAMALRPSDPSTFAFFDDHVGSAVASSVPLNTGSKNATSWRLWEEFCRDVWSTPPLRADSGELFNLNRERFLVAAFVVWLQSHDKVKSKIKGRSLPKPDTLMGHVYAVRRVHVLNGRAFHQFWLAKHVLRTLSARYCSLYGSVAPSRKEPLSRPMLKRLLAVPNGLSIGRRRTLDWTSWFGINLAAAMAVASSGGFRKGELALQDGASHALTRMSRASLFWIIRGAIVRAPTEAQLLALRPGDKAGLLAGPCKNDPWGAFFAAHPLYFAYDPEDADNTAVRLRTLVLRCPVPADRLRATPLFTSTSLFEPMRHRDLDCSLHALLVVVFGAQGAEKYSWHSFRVGLACALLAAGAPEATILALCRWRSPSSLRVYARISFEDYTSWLRRAEAEDVQAIQGPNLPPLPGQVWPGTTGTVPGALDDSAYELLERALRDLGDPHPDQLRELSDRAPEMDPDDFVANFQRLGLLAAEGGDSDAEDVE